ncbi:carbonic anhydrase 4 [Anolis carolinensis]|uniref:Carbonic anhydrase n=1 Tax=Anolis carolinensis TaxID=28377 RepID=H9GIJ2_ANOCA|nr:PREDICTED: carbonic anhydrase 4 [Anolis carolinensis]|eukprot:XP_008122875.1 PREDICTED: carbonic anhydrase 4 [Anolis carolinensis]
MASVWVPAVLTVVLLLLGGSYSSTGGPWCYNEAHCGPNTWLSIGHCGGKRQSPINILSHDSILNSKLGAVNLTGYEDRKKLLEIKNTGKTVDVELEDGLSLSGHGLPSSYTAKSFHLHWGDGVSKPGSEHTIDSKRYSMELHIVHTKNNMNVSDAVKDPEGIAVLGFFLEGSEKAKSKGKTAEAWEEFIKNLHKVSEKDKDEDLTSTISLLDLLGTTNLTSYYRYLGSLTTPQCNEAVIWTIFTDPILVPPKVVEAFPSELRSSDSSSGPPIKNNFRPLQKIGDRKVERSAGLGSAASFLSQSATLLLFLSITSLAASFPV